ncbi:MAG: hypothetical protein ACI9C1_001717 [Candidatus Aldehydirespiratoraceae bacterium]|jgi:hypothetical protein
MAEVRTSGVLASLKGFARRTLKRVPFAHRAAKEAVVALKLVRYRKDRERREHSLDADHLWQRRSKIAVELANPAALRSDIDGSGVAVETATGGYRFGPHESLRPALAPLFDAFPPDAAFLVLDDTIGVDADRHAVAAAAASADGGARVFDLVDLATTSETVLVLVTAPASGRAYDAAPIDPSFDRDAATDSVIDRHEETLHFGDVLTVVRGGDRFLYQDVPGRSAPGRRDTGARIEEITGLLARHGTGFDGRVVFDVCCNSGMMMGEALARGARWSVGWDYPSVAAAADDLLGVLGAGRSELHGVLISDETDFVADVPDWLAVDDAVCLFLAAWHHVRFPPGVGDLPWAWLVYEGQENEDTKITTDNIATMEKRWNATAVESSTHSDGICGPRPLVLLKRNV